jgi:zinc D-Ala-D-Ala dipeptidase
MMAFYPSQRKAVDVFFAKFFVIVAGVLFHAQVNAKPLDELFQSRQLLTVKVKNWTSHTGILQRYSRENQNAEWQVVGAEIAVVLGKNGLAWGQDQEGYKDINGVLPRIKREGDGQSPAGIFPLRRAFGYAAADPNIKLAYTPLTASIECIDDHHSVYYNQLLDRQSIAHPDWVSSEQMAQEPLYKWGIVIEHNTHQIVPNAGSCLFIHIAKNNDSPTAGCTAMREEDLKMLLHWLESSAASVLVQLPEDEYRRLRTTWRLP